MSAIWISEAEVVGLVSLPDAVGALERILPLEAQGQAQNLQKTQTTWGSGHTLHALGATMQGAGLVGCKVWAHAGGATPLLVLWDAESGELRAVIEAFALGQMRTAAVSAVATQRMAAETADELAIVGSGRQALAQVAAVVAVRSLSRIRVFSPTQNHRDAFAAELRTEQAGARVDVCESVADAVRDAPLITLVTRSREPLLSAAMVAAGAHINAVGAIGPERAELAADLFPRCDLLVADNVVAAQTLAGDVPTATECVSLSGLLAGGWSRQASTDLTIFKSMGMGLSDLAVGALVLERAETAGLGRALPATERARPRLWRADGPSKEGSDV